MPQTFVELFEDKGGWTVRVVERGEMIERDFQFRNQAAAWAAGQRIRLDLSDTTNPFPNQVPFD
ncbi:hypothetical protein FB593_1125 [Rhizobium sp. SJZ105]|uniref:hypothetical protein n=1 Tax=Rhizobium sp. SJZ105 TaxID=2572678 RepID=UPI0011A856D3|nr:hypothetical protein [Rhizobium sp. SJZ105]TWC78321.1 hypothetical protein FB593_1125 [Rhizobium sp. SJZ105]